MITLATIEAALNTFANQDADNTIIFPAHSFLANRQVIRRRAGRGVVAEIDSTSLSDVHEISSWYEENTSDQPTYADDPEWKEWWITVLSGKRKDLETLRLLTAESSAPLAFMALKEVNDWLDDEKPTLYLNGLRINPLLMPREQEKRKYSGCGTALITFAVIESVRRGLSGITVNSSKGVERFYRWLGFREQSAFDGSRSSFSLKGDDPRLNYLLERYREGLLALQNHG